MAPDAQVAVEVLRQGRTETLSFALGRFEAEQTAALESNESDEGRASERLGATLATLTPTARDQLGLDTESEGVVITSLDGKGVAADAGLEVGDVILQIGATAVASPMDVDHALEATKTDAVLMQIERQGAKIFVGVRLA